VDQDVGSQGSGAARIAGRPSADPRTPPTPLARSRVLAATIGNALEFYDFVTYSLFSIQIGHAFFPSHDAYVGLMLSLATFGAGFLTRPIGALVIGGYSDRAGRRPAMMLSFTLMGASIVALALVPPYAAIGIAAPILAVAARMLQGFSLGGEVGPTTAYLLESAPVRDRGLIVSWQAASSNIAIVAGGLVGVTLSALLSRADLDGYGWRIAFLLGAATLPFGLWIRRSLPETLGVPEGGEAVEPLALDAAAGTARAEIPRLALAVRHRRILFLGLVVLGAATMASYTMNYLTTYAQNTLHMSPGVSILVQVPTNLVGVGFLLLGGWLSDRVGRRPVMIWANLGMILSILPVFFWIVQTRSVASLLVGSTILGIFNSLTGGAFYAALTETLPRRIRGGAFAVVYAVAIAVFGGTTQLTITWLNHVTGDPMAPAWYVLAATIVGQAGLMLIPESAPVKVLR
jgi:MFS family permease